MNWGTKVREIAKYCPQTEAMIDFYYKQVTHLLLRRIFLKTTLVVCNSIRIPSILSIELQSYVICEQNNPIHIAIYTNTYVRSLVIDICKIAKNTAHELLQGSVKVSKQCQSSDSPREREFVFIII